MCAAGIKDTPPRGRASEAGTVTYERKCVTDTDLLQLSKDFDVVIIAAGAGDLGCLRVLTCFTALTDDSLRFA